MALGLWVATVAGSICASIATALFATIAIGVVIYYILQKNRQQQQSWHQAAKTLGLQHRFEKTLFGQHVTPMTGSYQGFEVRITTFTRGSGEQSTTHTSVEMMCPAELDLGLHIKPENIIDNVRKAFGTQDIHIGDQRFDDAFIIKGNDPAEVVGLLTPPVRQKLLALNNQSDLTRLTDQGLYQEWGGMITDPHRLAGHLRQQLLFMALLEQAHSAQVMAHAEIDAKVW